MIDVAIVVGYFVVIFVVGFRSRTVGPTSADEYFMSSRSLTWPAIAMSTIATNISASHFLGMAGSSYKFGLAQANFELNAILGIVLSAFVFVPMFLKAKVTTVTEFFEAKFGAKVALAYSVLMMLLYGLLYLGGGLYWAAYAIDTVFPDLTRHISADSPIVRLAVLAIALGVFSASYTYLGGLSAVVRTDKVQFVLLLIGGLVTVYFAIDALGGFSKLWELSSLSYPKDHPMHLHLPASDSKIPWIALIGMNLLNLQYWGANQVILQRALAAKNLREAQLGLLAGGVFKYIMVLIIVVPAIALIGILDKPLADPDLAYRELVNMKKAGEFVIPNGVRGMILCGLFASMMSTIDSIFNSLSTLFSIDIYKRHLKPQATDAELVRVGKMTIGGALLTGLVFAFIVIFLKFGGDAHEEALMHFFKEMGYYVKNGFVVLIVAAAFLVRPNRRIVFLALICSIPLTYGLKIAAPEMNYLVRAGWVIIATTLLVAVPSWWATRALPAVGSASARLEISTRSAGLYGAALLASLAVVHVIFH